MVNKMPRKTSHRKSKSKKTVRRSKPRTSKKTMKRSSKRSKKYSKKRVSRRKSPAIRYAPVSPHPGQYYVPNPAFAGKSKSDCTGVFRKSYKTMYGVRVPATCASPKGQGKLGDPSACYGKLKRDCGDDCQWTKRFTNSLGTTVRGHCGLPTGRGVITKTSLPSVPMYAPQPAPLLALPAPQPAPQPAPLLALPAPFIQNCSASSYEYNKDQWCGLPRTKIVRDLRPDKNRDCELLAANLFKEYKEKCHTSL